MLFEGWEIVAIKTDDETVRILKKGNVIFSPQLPTRKVQAIQNLGMGVFDKVYLRFADRFWSREPTWFEYIGENPKAWPMFLNIWKFNEQPILAAFNVGAFAQSLERQTDRDVINGAMTVLRTIYGKNTPEPIAAKVTRWGSDPYSLGAYSYIPKGETAANLDVLGEPVDNRLFFAGEATSSKDYATVHAAYLSGIRAADQIKAMNLRSAEAGLTTGT